MSCRRLANKHRCPHPEPFFVHTHLSQRQNLSASVTDWDEGRRAEPERPCGKKQRRARQEVDAFPLPVFADLRGVEPEQLQHKCCCPTQVTSLELSAWVATPTYDRMMPRDATSVSLARNKKNPEVALKAPNSGTCALPVFSHSMCHNRGQSSLSVMSQREMVPHK